MQLAAHPPGTLSIEQWVPAPYSVLLSFGLDGGRLSVETFQPDPNGLYIPGGQAPACPAQAAAAQPQCHGAVVGGVVHD